jgi:hypothetical protein
VAEQRTDLLERLEARAAPTTTQPRRSLNYNYPLGYYRRPDGDIVQLQSDPNNRTLYEDLGFVLLRPTEVREWLEEIRPNVILEEKKRAGWINAIRRLQSQVPQFVLDDEEQLEFPNMPIDELEARYKEICDQFGIKARRPTIKPERESASDPALAGVETNASIEEIQSKMSRAPEGTIQGHGFDPLKESRRRQA